MRSLVHAVGVAFGAALATAAAPAVAETLPIEVPVAVRGLPPNVSEGAVTCAVFTEIDGHTSNLGYGGFGSERFTVRDGVFAGRIRVPVVLDVGSASLLRSYRCTLYFVRRANGDRRTGAAAQLSDPAGPDYRAEFRRAPGSRFAGVVKGAF